MEFIPYGAPWSRIANTFIPCGLLSPTAFNLELHSLKSEALWRSTALNLEPYEALWPSIWSLMERFCVKSGALWNPIALNLEPYGALWSPVG